VGDVLVSSGAPRPVFVARCSPTRYAGSMIQITPWLSIGESELHFDFIRASGPGGQNVNKVSDAVQLRFDAANSPSMPEGVKERLVTLARNRMSAEGVLIIKAQRFRSQTQNREDAVSRLVTLVRTAALPPKPRRATRPSRASKEERLAGKRHRAKAKGSRGSVASEQD